MLVIPWARCTCRANTVRSEPFSSRPVRIGWSSLSLDRLLMLLRWILTSDQPAGRFLSARCRLALLTPWRRPFRPPSCPALIDRPSGGRPIDGLGVAAMLAAHPRRPCHPAVIAFLPGPACWPFISTPSPFATFALRLRPPGPVRLLANVLRDWPHRFARQEANRRLVRTLWWLSSPALALVHVPHCAACRPQSPRRSVACDACRAPARPSEQTDWASLALLAANFAGHGLAACVTLADVPEASQPDPSPVRNCAFSNDVGRTQDRRTGLGIGAGLTPADLR